MKYDKKIRSPPYYLLLNKCMVTNEIYIIIRI